MPAPRLSPTGASSGGQRASTQPITCKPFISVWHGFAFGDISVLVVCIVFAFTPSNTEPNHVCLLPGSACQGPLSVVRGPAHGPRVDVVKLAATPWAPVLVALSIFEELAFAVPHSSRNGSVVSGRNEREPSQNRGNGHNVD